MALLESLQSYPNIVETLKSRQRIAHTGRGEEMLKLWRLVRRGGALEMDPGRHTEAEGKPGEGLMSPEGRGSSGGRLLRRAKIATWGG